MKKLAALLVSLVLVLSCFGASYAADEGTVFKAAMTTNPLSLDEGYSSTTATRQVSAYIYETLFTVGEDYSIIPMLAESYKASDDQLVYDIVIRQGITFHDGSAMDAEDVVASYKRFNTTLLHADRFIDVVSCEATDQNTVRFTLSKPVTLIEFLALPQRAVIMPKEIAEKYMTSELRGADVIGTGPYKLVEWTPDVHVKMAKFDAYVPDNRYTEGNGFGGLRVATFDTIYMQPVTEAESRIAGLETGEFDFAESVPVTSYDRIANNPAIKASIIGARWSILVELNHGEAPMDKLAFRKALVYAINPKEVMEAVVAGNPDFYKLSPSVFAPDQFYYSEGGSQGLYNTQDLTKVAELLKEAGYNGEEIAYNVNRDYDWMYKACIVLADQWQKAGINIRLDFYDWASQIAKAQSLEGWHINQTGWSQRLDPTQIKSSLYSTSTGAYNYKNPDMDKMLDELAIGNPLEERKEIWEGIQKLVWDDVANIKIGFYNELEGISSKYEGFKSFYVIPRFWNLTLAK